MLQVFFLMGYLMTHTSGEGGVDVVLSCFLVEEASGLDEMGNGDPFSRSHATLVLRNVSVDPDVPLTPCIPPTVQDPDVIIIEAIALSPAIPDVELLLHADCNEQEVMCEISRYHFSYGAQSADDHAHFLIATLDLQGGGLSTTLVLQTHPPPPEPAPTDPDPGSPRTLGVGRLGLPLSQSGSLLTEVVFLVFSKDKELSAPLGGDALLHCGFRQQETGQEVGQEVAVEWRVQHRGRGVRVLDLKVLIDSPEHSQAGKVTREGASVDIALLVAGGNASMTLRELKVSDEGTYICTINIGIVKAQQTIKLHVHKPPHVFLSENKLVSQEFPDKLSCHCQNYYPLDAKTEWFSISPGNAEMTDLSGRTSLSSHQRHRDGTLSLSSSLDLEQSSFPPGTTLTCRVTHPALAVPFSISLVVQEPIAGPTDLIYLLVFLPITVLCCVLLYLLMRRISGCLVIWGKSLSSGTL